MGLRLQPEPLDFHRQQADFVAGIDLAGHVATPFRLVQRPAHFRALGGQRLHGVDRAIEFPHQLAHLQRFDSRQRRGDLVLETGRPGQQRGDHHRHQYRRDLARHAAQSVHDGKRQHPHGEGRPVSVVQRFLDHLHDGLVVMLGAVDVDTEQLGQLGRGNDDGRGVGEAIDHRVREEIHHQAQPQHPDQELQQTHHHGEQDGVGDVAFGAGRRQRLQRGRGHQ